MERFDEMSRRRRRAHQRLLELKSGVYAAILDMERVFGAGSS